MPRGATKVGKILARRGYMESLDEFSHSRDPERKFVLCA
jgi:hypothetical protein